MDLPGELYVYRGEGEDAIAVAAHGTGPRGGWVGIDICHFPVPSKYLSREQINALAEWIVREGNRARAVIHTQESGK